MSPILFLLALPDNTEDTGLPDSISNVFDCISFPVGADGCPFSMPVKLAKAREVNGKIDHHVGLLEYSTPTRTETSAQRFGFYAL